MSVPISELLSPASKNLREGERRQVRLMMPYCQALLDQPDQLDPLLLALSARVAFEAPKSHREGIDTKIPMIPLMTVLGHQVAMKMLAGFENTSTAHSSRKTEIPILATVPSEAITARKFDITEHHIDPFVEASMKRLNPYFELALEEIMQEGNSYAPIWKKYADLVPLNTRASTNPALIDHDRRHNNSNPISRLHNTFWSGAATMPIFAANLAPLIYSDDITTVGEFQQQAIQRGAVGVLAKATEVIKASRNKVLEKGQGVIPIEFFSIDPDTAIIQYNEALSVKPNFAKIIDEGLTLCSAPYGLLDPSAAIQEVCRSHNTRMGSDNRTSPLFLPDNPENVTSIAEVFAYDALLTAPSTLWQPFLEARGIKDWSDALPGTRLPDGSIMRRESTDTPGSITIVKFRS